jgi:hypothetical protein
VVVETMMCTNNSARSMRAEVGWKVSRSQMNVQMLGTLSGS